jgi:ABC-type sulfate transport system substrate-binding protein
MNRLTINLIAAAVIALPIASHAQSTSTVTRAQVRAELVQLEKAGYTPGRANDPHYPDDIQAAEAKISAQRNTDATVETSFGGVQDSPAESGSRAVAKGFSSLYARH